ncbi:hypothetical protein MAPG_04694 [Magnaporthiopsis poae ATCC 64411]|uniref:Uncharacterized protein n=1 Tax=Magnaporthiopsis poae (strain ATCC 64411 / 73-15) TaxID=644358 RepID=A0A0C4DXE7_MAGP6|nr:hypothetical protein MAPG_04694 [Magnaporthiopsis poae ATCC 64411]
MQFSILSVFTMAVAVSAAALSQNEGFQVVKRQAAPVAQEVPVNQPAMSKADGSIVAFDPANVYLPSAAGQ